MTTRDECYVGVMDCGCVVAAIFDTEYEDNYLENTLKGYKLAGYKIERMTVEEARKRLSECKCQKKLTQKHTETKE